MNFCFAEHPLNIYDLSYSKIQEIASKSDNGELPSFAITILRNITLEPIEPYLLYLALGIGLRTEIKFGEYDNIFQEAIGGQKNLLNPSTDCVLIFSQLETLSPDLTRKFSALTEKDIGAEKERIMNFVNDVLEGIQKQTSAMILWHSFELPAYPSPGIMDSQSEMSQSGAIGQLNAFLRKKLRDIGNAYLVDLNLCIARIGTGQFYDRRHWHMARAPYSLDAYREIAVEDFKFIRPLKGKNKKCLVLDCDNTLWGGIIGEDGLSGIKLGKTYPGSAFYEFQQEILNLYNRGIILALCSRNNEDDVREVFRNHPEMVLKEEHIATAQINWDDKVTNLQRIAQNLNIGLDSMVFVDDNEFELDMVRRFLPEVEVIYLPEGKAVAYRDILVSYGLFDTLTFSAEDKARGAMYKAEAKQKKLAARCPDMESYLRSLEMVVTIRFADEFSIPRIAQLTQKTNQFNLTTKRYSEAEIKSMAQSEESDVLYLHLKHRFGDSGIVGVCILKHEADKTVFDTFLLSCRVLGRKVEDVFLVQSLKIAQARKKKMAIGQYFATRKNTQVKDFYAKRAFEVIEQDETKSIAACDLESFEPVVIDFFKEIHTDNKIKNEATA